VLIIAAHAADSSSESTSLTGHAVGPEAMYSLAETGSTLRKYVDNFALDAANFGDDLELDHYESEDKDDKRRRSARAKRRRQKRRALREEQRHAHQVEADERKDRRVRAKEWARRAAEHVRDLRRIQANKTSRNANQTAGERRVRKRLNHLSSEKRRAATMLKRIERDEFEARYFMAKAREHEAKAHEEATDALASNTKTKWDRRDRDTEFAVQAGTAAVDALQGQVETEDLRADRRFWDAYYGKKEHISSKPKKLTKDSRTLADMAADLNKPKNATKQRTTKDLSLPLYKASHIASYKEASGKSSRIKELDANLKEDGDAFLKFAALYN